MAIDFNTILTPEQLFTHVDKETGKHVTVAVQRLRSSIKFKLLPEVRINVDYEHGISLLDSLDATRLQSHINMRELPPAITIIYGDGKDVMVDGEYSYCAALARGMSSITCIRVPFSVWNEFVVTGVPFTEAQLRALSLEKPRTLN